MVTDQVLSWLLIKWFGDVKFADPLLVLFCLMPRCGHGYLPGMS